MTISLNAYKQLTSEERAVLVSHLQRDATRAKLEGRSEDERRIVLEILRIREAGEW